MRLQLLSILSILCILSLHAQPNRFGVPMITNYPYQQTGGSEQNWCITQDHRGVVYVGNHEKGVLEYDGVEWRSIPIPNNVPVRSLVTGEKGTVYVGAEGDFGLLEPNVRGELCFHSLYDSTLRSEIPNMNFWKTYGSSGKIYFCASEGIIVYNPETARTRTIQTPETASLSFMIGDQLYNSDWQFGLMVFQGDHFEKVQGGDFFHEKDIVGLDRYDADKLLVSTMLDGIFLLNTHTGIIDDSFLEPALMDEFRSNVITYARKMKDDILVCTYSNGLYILNRDGIVKELISDSEGLIENTISHVYTDEALEGSGPLWIAHWEGVSKIEANNPFRVFTEGSGFKNLITDIVEFNGTLFISTMSGVFYKSSTASSTRFRQIPEIESEVYDLKVFEPSPGRSMLLACMDREILVIDNRLRVSSLSDNMLNPPEDPEDLEQIAGRFIITDPDKPNVIYTGYSHAVGLEYRRGKWKEVFRYRDLHEAIYRLARDRYGYLWISTPMKVIRIDLALSQETIAKDFSKNYGLPAIEDNTVFINPENKNVLLGTRDGFYRFNYFQEKFVPDSLFNSVLPGGENIIRTFYCDNDGDYWLSFENEFRGWGEMVIRKNEDQMEIISETPFLRLTEAAAVDMIFSDPEYGVWFSKSDELYHFDKTFSRDETLPFHTLVRKVVLNTDSVIFNGSNFRMNEHGNYTLELSQDEETQPVINYKFNNVGFQWAAPYFEQEDQLLYTYLLEGFSKNWSEYSKINYKEFTNLKYGKYTLFIKARNVYGDESEAASFSFVITRPWYASVLAILGYVLFSILLVYLIIWLYTRRLTQENLRLEGVIGERTAKIRRQKEELTDSIEYASRIQRALLPSERIMEEHNLDHFILFRPRDIVSGDFYWIGEKDDKILIVAADCTGHGVPGAFMSMLGMTFLDEIVIKSEITSTDEIMEALREHVIYSLEQSGDGTRETIRDGMDLAMISVDIKNQMIQYSGAYNPLYLVRGLKRSEKTRIQNGKELDLPRGSMHDNEHVLIQIKADQMPIGISEKKMRFNSTRIKDEAYSIYMFSDGYLDQFGGPYGKKFMSRNFKKLILELQAIPLNRQGEELEKVLLEWMGDIGQIDDILVMGLRINPQ